MVLPMVPAITMLLLQLEALMAIVARLAEDMVLAKQLLMAARALLLIRTLLLQQDEDMVHLRSEVLAWEDTMDVFTGTMDMVFTLIAIYMVIIAQKDINSFFLQTWSF